MGVSLRFRFHGELNDFLSPARRNHEFESVAGETDTMKHVIESLGIPHTEIGSVRVNGKDHSLTEKAPPGASVDVFPHTLPIHLEHPRFVLDGHLGRLAAYLRMIGFDTWYDRCADDALLASVAGGEHRVLLTRDVGLLKRREIESGYCVRSDLPRPQLREVSRRFALHSRLEPFRRCMACNAPLYSVPKAEVADQLPPHTRETKNEFSRCSSCGKIYWRGSHHARMLGWIDELSAMP
jgi:uncharacterized protein with PIN domain